MASGYRRGAARRHQEEVRISLWRFFRRPSLRSACRGEQGGPVQASGYRTRGSPSARNDRREKARERAGQVGGPLGGARRYSGKTLLLQLLFSETDPPAIACRALRLGARPEYDIHSAASLEKPS